MKNLNTNESTSFESSLGSPTKPLQPNEVQKPKQLFFVNNIEETPQPLLNTIINLGPIPKPRPTEKKNLKKKIKIESGQKPPKIKINIKRPHILNFDALIKNIIFPEKKTGKSANKKMSNSGTKSRYKFMGNKRIRNLFNNDPNSKSKFKYNNDFKIFMFVNLAINIKKKKIDNKALSNKSKGKSNTCNNISNSHYNLYDINNFFSCAIKIREKSIAHNVLCPTFEELSQDFFEDNNIEVSSFY